MRAIAETKEAPRSISPEMKLARAVILRAMLDYKGLPKFISGEVQSIYDNQNMTVQDAIYELEDLEYWLFESEEPEESLIFWCEVIHAEKAPYFARKIREFLKENDIGNILLKFRD